jgi:hypothetical protein
MLTPSMPSHLAQVTPDGIGSPGDVNTQVAVPDGDSSLPVIPTSAKHSLEPLE